MCTTSTDEQVLRGRTLRWNETATRLSEGTWLFLHVGACICLFCELLFGEPRSGRRRTSLYLGDSSFSGVYLGRQRTWPLHNVNNWIGWQTKLADWPTRWTSHRRPATRWSDAGFCSWNPRTPKKNPKKSKKSVKLQKRKKSKNTKNPKFF